MKLTKWKIFFAMLAVSAFLLVSCDETTTEPEPDVFKPVAPSGLMATSLDNQTIRIKWTHSADVDNPKFKEYEIVVTGGGPLAPVSKDKQSNTYELTGLDEGTVYTFEVSSVSTEGEKSAAVSIKWSPASRFTESAPNFANPIRVYETASSFGSGLLLYDADNEGPVIKKVANGAEWDLGLYTTGKLVFGSAKLLTYNFGTNPVNIVEISDNVLTGYNSLDEVYDSQALSAGSFKEQLIDLTKYNQNIVLVVRKKASGEDKWHYAKVFIKYLNDAFLMGQPDNRYIELVVSYQMVADVPYARIGKIK